MREMPQSQKTRHHHGEFCIPLAKSARAELPLNYNAILYDEAPPPSLLLQLLQRTLH